MIRGLKTNRLEGISSPISEVLSVKAESLKEDNNMKEERMIDLLANTNTNIFEIHKHNCKDVLNKICISQPPARTIKVEYLDGEIEEIKRVDPNSIFKIFNCAKEDK